MIVSCRFLVAHSAEARTERQVLNLWFITLIMEGSIDANTASVGLRTCLGVLLGSSSVQHTRLLP